MGTLWVHAFEKVIGKKISGIVVAQRPDTSPRRQIFIVFEDGTNYELYGSDVAGCNDLDRGGLNEIREHLYGRPGIQILLDAGPESAA